MNDQMRKGPEGRCFHCDDRSCASQVLKADEVATLSANCSEGSFVRNEPLLKEGTPMSNILYLKSGLVKEFSTTTAGHEHILQIVKGRTYLGLHSLFGDRFNRYSYTALSNVSVCFIDMNTFKQMILENGRFSYAILSTVCRDSLSNYHRLTAKQEQQLSGKIADALLYFSRDIFDNISFELPLNRREIACLTGISRESVTKQLNNFEAEGLISVEGRRVRLLDVAKLEMISRFG